MSATGPDHDATPDQRATNARRRDPAASEPPVLPDLPPDERDEAWGERGDRDEDWYRRERPPHHE